MAATNVEAIHRLSPTQEGMLYHCLQSGGQEQGRGDGSYLVQYSCRYGDVDDACLQRAWDQAIGRHAALRSLFTWERRSQPLQLVRARVDVPIEQHDWRGLDAAEQDRRWQSLTERDRDRGFDLGCAPLMRLALLRIDDTHTRFLWSFHHLLLDGWSIRLVLDEVTRIYTAQRRGQEAVLATARPFADFVAWRETRDTRGEECFWRNTLQGFRTPTTLDLGGTDTGTGRSGAVRELVVTPACLARLQALARVERVTVNVMLLAAWSLLLGRYTGSDDVVFGTTVAGRPVELAGVQGMAGLFINTLPLRVQLRPDECARDWLTDIQARQRALLVWEQSPLVSIKRWSELAPGTPLFESIVAYESMPAEAGDTARDASLQASDERYVEYSNYPLALLALPGDTLTLRLVYDPARFAGSAVAGMLEQVVTTLDAMSHSLEGTVATLPTLARGELARVLAQARGRETDFGPPRCIHELVQAQVSRAPAATAVVDPDGTLGYAELWESSGRLAARLATAGVTCDTPVPVLLERSRAAIIAIVAVLRAGGAYVPMDPGWPSERVGRTLKDLAGGQRLRAVICESSALDVLGDAADVAITMDRAETGSDAAASFIPPAHDASCLAYLIYTSGSSGQPKGVMVSHANLYNSVHARADCYPRAPGVFLLMSPLATDSSVAGLFWTLCNGGTLLLPKPRAEQDAEGLGLLVARHGATHTLCLPSLYAALLESADPARLASLQTVIVAGEACAPGVVAQHYRALPGARLYNEYGPSEATVWATATELAPQAANGTVPIGRPVANTSVHVLDPALCCLPAGVAGELCIGGPNVARGYHRRPELDAERFVADPFSDVPGARLYRSGDRVRRHEDGTLEFLGRIDNQIKVLGYRVEPEEIEAALNSHPGVAESAVGFAARQPARQDAEWLARELRRLTDRDAESRLAEIEQLTAADVDARLELARRDDTETTAP